MSTRAAAGRRIGTINRELSVLRAAINAYADKHRGAPRPPILDLGNSGRRERHLSQEEAKRLLAACRHPHLRLYVMLALASAVRPGELLSLTWDRVDLEAGIIFFRNPDVQESNKRARPFRVPAPLRPVLEAARARATCPFVIEYAGRGVDSIRTAFRSAVIAAGIDAEGAAPYILRHSWATWAVRGGVPLREVADRLGHSSTRMAEHHYYHHSPEYQERSDALTTMIAGELGMSLTPPARAADGPAS